MASPLRIGVVGCGAIAQIQHLPNLAALPEAFQISAVCDVSATLSQHMARTYQIEAAYTDLASMLNQATLDAVLLCQTDPKIEAARAVLSAGKHLFIEKPVAFVPEDVDELAASAQAGGLVAQAGYMKIFDPAFEQLVTEVDALGDTIRFVQINHLHTNNAHHLAAYDLVRADDLTKEGAQQLGQARDAHVLRALGPVEGGARRAFFHLAGSMIHDLYGLRRLFGPVRGVVSAEFWNEGDGISTILDCGEGIRCTATWVELLDIRYFHETLEVYGDGRGLILTYPTGFAREVATLTVRGPDAEGTGAQWQPVIEGEIAFVRELRHFHDCVAAQTPCRASLAEARHDVQLVIDIVRAATQR